jgi:hypothetical protein
LSLLRLAKQNLSAAFINLLLKEYATHFEQELLVIEELLLLLDQFIHLTPRCITVREAARLHSYPDWFRFHVTKWHGFRQIGNSVPPLLAKAVASEIIKVLGVCPSKSGIIQELGNENLLVFDMSQAARYYGVNPQIIEPRARKSR